MYARSARRSPQVQRSDRARTRRGPGKTPPRPQRRRQTRGADDARRRVRRRRIPRRSCPVANSPRHHASSALSSKPSVSSTAPPASGASRIVQRRGERRDPQRLDRVQLNTLPNSRPNTTADAAGDEQPRDREALAQRESGRGDDEALAHVAEHVAEHQRHGEREQHARVGLVARRHAERAAEDLERPRPDRIGEQERRLRPGRRRRKMEQRARACPLQRTRRGAHRRNRSSIR